MGKRKKIILIFGAVLLAAVLIRSLRFFVSKPKQTDNIIPVKTIKPTYRNLEEILNLTGDIRGISEAKVYAKIPGKLSEKVKDIGDIVSKDDTVAFVDRDEPAFEYKPSEVKSPISGVITQYFTDIGETVGLATPILEVASIDRIKVSANITETDMPRISKGMSIKFSVDAYPDKIFSGKISKISQSVNLQTRTAQIEAELTNENSLLKPGMFAKIDIILSVHNNVLSIPEDALGEINSHRYVYIVKDNIAYKKDIKTGITQNNFMEVRQGIAANDRVVSVGWQNLKDGAKVEISEK